MEKSWIFYYYLWFVNPWNTDVDYSRHSVLLLAPVYLVVEMKYALNLESLLYVGTYISQIT